MNGGGTRRQASYESPTRIFFLLARSALIHPDTLASDAVANQVTQLV